MHSDFDLAVIGGGINGAGIARDAAMRGIKVILLEKSDFAAGASGHNGRMIHGGLKYLETFDISLVREALNERRVLKHIAPHLVRDMDLTMPIRKGQRPKLMIAAGLLFFDMLNLFRDPRSHLISAKKTLEVCRGITDKGLTGAAVIYDAWAEYSERLTIENLVDAAAHSAVILNRAEVTGLELVGSRGAVEVNITHEGAGRETVTASVVVNATGAWADEVLATTTKDNERMLRASKGTIMIADGLKGAPDRPVFFEAQADKRPVLIAPWNGMHLIGTTDIVVDNPIDEVWAEKHEVDYLISEMNREFPIISLSRDNVRYLYTGVRPLPFSIGRSAKASRHHVIKKQSGFSGRVITVIGGKLSTYRKISEDVLRAAGPAFRAQLPVGQTAQKLLPGALNPSEAEEIRARSASLGLPEFATDHLLAVYGARALLILALIKGTPALSELVDDETGATAAEIHFVVQDEWARNLTDILVRRTMIGRNRYAGTNAVPAVLHVLKDLGWSADDLEKNKSDYEEFIAKSTGLISSGRKRERYDPA